MPSAPATPSDSDDPLESRLRRVKRRRALKALLISLGATAVAVYAVFGLALALAVVDGSSMSPALKDGDVVVFSRLANSYQTGDIALVETEDGTEQVKRIVALPGQTVDIQNDTGTLLVDGEAMLEPYIYEGTYRTRLNDYPVVLGEDEYFVLGDNRSNSRDSRSYGVVAGDQLEGKLLFLAFRWEA